MRFQRIVRLTPATLVLLVGLAAGIVSAVALADPPRSPGAGLALSAPAPPVAIPHAADPRFAIAATPSAAAPTPVAPVAAPDAPPVAAPDAAPVAAPAPGPSAPPAEPAPAPASAPADIAFTFAGPDGPTAAGEVALRWLDDAELHGVTLAVPAELAAWRTAPTPAGRDGAERALRDALTALAAALPPVPNTAPVLVGADGQYLSPDTLWSPVVAALTPPAPPKPVKPAAPAKPTEPAAAAAAAAAPAAAPAEPATAPAEPAAPTEPADAPDLAAQVLAAAQRGDLDAWLTARAPTRPEYTALVTAARRYRALCAAGGWPEVAVPKAKAQLGSKWTDTDAVAALQRRLAIEGFFTGEAAGVYDAATQQGVDAYRAARALWDKPWYDDTVATQLNVPCDRRLATLLLNVRRWRHTAMTTETTYVQVNLAGAELRYVRDGALRGRHRTVVGSGRSFIGKVSKRRIRQNATPVLHDEISNVVVNPEWTVPARLARQEIGPAIEKDPTYLETHGFRVVTTPNGQQLYVQGSGPGNALGQVKLTFPNSESIYLHDTPRKGFFLQPRRDFSHGCVRVQDALGLATAVLVDDYAKRGDTLNPHTLKSLTYGAAKTYWYALTQPVPVFLEYYTASVADDGTVVFHPDIYEYDADTLAAAVPLR